MSSTQRLHLQPEEDLFLDLVLVLGIFFSSTLTPWLEWIDQPLWRLHTRTWGSSSPTIPPIPPWTSLLRWETFALWISLRALAVLGVGHVGKCLSTSCDSLQELKKYGVTTVVRVCEATYDTSLVLKEGIQVLVSLTFKPCQLNSSISLTGGKKLLLSKHCFCWRSFFCHSQIHFWNCVLSHHVTSENRKSLPPHSLPSCVSPPAGFNIHTSFVLFFWAITLVSSSPFYSSSSLLGLAVWWRGPTLQPDSGRLAKPAEAEVQGRGRLLCGRPLCGRTGQVSNESRFIKERSEINFLYISSRFPSQATAGN